MQLGLRQSVACHLAETSEEADELSPRMNATSIT